MSYDVEYEIGYRPSPATKTRPTGRPWCSACGSYHSYESGCEDDE